MLRFVERELCGGGGVGDLYFGVVWDKLFFGALFVEVDVGIAMVKFPLWVFVFSDGALTGLNNL